MSTHREKVLGQARADLTQLPDLCDQLEHYLTERSTTDAYHHKVVGSPALIRLDILKLLDRRRKEGWDTEDPRETRLSEWLGIVPLLELWVKVVWQDVPDLLELVDPPTVRSETSVLIEYWPLIETKDWAERLAQDITQTSRIVKAALGIRPAYQPTCRWCRDKVNPVDEHHRITTWDACAYGLCAGCGKTFPKGPALDALAQLQDPMPLPEIAAITGIPVKTLHRWRSEGLITPVEDRRRGSRYDLPAIKAVANTKFARQVS